MKGPPAGLKLAGHMGLATLPAAPVQIPASPSHGYISKATVPATGNPCSPQDRPSTAFTARPAAYEACIAWRRNSVLGATAADTFELLLLVRGDDRLDSLLAEPATERRRFEEVGVGLLGPEEFTDLLRERQVTGCRPPQEVNPVARVQRPRCEEQLTNSLGAIRRHRTVPP